MHNKRLIQSNRIKNVKKIIYASSSSVYGESKTFPLNEKQKILPKNFYGLTKKINEQMAEIYSNYYKIIMIYKCTNYTIRIII